MVTTHQQTLSKYFCCIKAFHYFQTINTTYNLLCGIGRDHCDN